MARKIKYAIERDGAHGNERESIDNPTSPNFLPMDSRTEHQKARWWALHGKKSTRSAMGQMEPGRRD